MLARHIFLNIIIVEVGTFLLKKFSIQSVLKKLKVKMIFTTERQRADKEVDHLKSLIKSLSLNYLWTESSYSISINVRKSFINDHSKGSATNIALSTSTPTRFSPRHLSLIHI